MKVSVLSDTHLEHCNASQHRHIMQMLTLASRTHPSDVVVLAGDQGCPHATGLQHYHELLTACKRVAPKVVWVSGNHEYLPHPNWPSDPIPFDVTDEVLRRLGHSTGTDF